MKEITYIDQDGRTVTKKEGFSWPTFWLLLIFGFIICGVIYAVVKGSFIQFREMSRDNKREAEKNKEKV